MLPKKHDIIQADKETHLYLSNKSWRSKIDWLSLYRDVKGVYVAPAGVLVRFGSAKGNFKERQQGYLVPPAASIRKFLRKLNSEVNFYQVRVDFNPHDFSFFRMADAFTRADREAAYKKAFGVE